MKRYMLGLVILVSSTMAVAAQAERLELGLVLAPTWMQDESVEAFSDSNRFTGRFGLDLRSEIAVGAHLSLVPLIAYRYGSDAGDLFGLADTELKTHELTAGLRLRAALLSWLTPFAEVRAGAAFVAMEADTFGYMSHGRGSYSDRAVTWTVGGLVGLETHLSRRWLEGRGVDWFCFGGEIAVGYVRQGDVGFDPALDRGDENSIAVVGVGGWGDVNLSGVVLQIGASLYFL